MAQNTQKNSTFVATLCRSGEAKLVGAARFKRMAESASLSEAVSILKESAFGGGDNFSAGEYQKIIAAEEELFVSFVKQNAPNEACAAHYLIPYDFRNAEALVKSLSLDKNAQKYLCAEGKFTAEQLTDYILNGKNCGLYPELKTAINNALNEFKSGAPSGMRISAAFVREKFLCLMRLSRYGFFKQAIEREIIAANISACLRSQSEQTARLMLISVKNGKKTIALTNAQITALCEKDVQKAKKAFEGSEYKQTALFAIEQCAAGPLIDLERESMGYCVSALNDKKYSDLSGEFVFSLYCNRRKNEIYCAELCLTAKANGVAPEQILKRLIAV